MLSVSATASSVTAAKLVPAALPKGGAFNPGTDGIVTDTGTEMLSAAQAIAASVKINKEVMPHVLKVLFFISHLPKTSTFRGRWFFKSL